MEWTVAIGRAGCKGLAQWVLYWRMAQRDRKSRAKRMLLRVWGDGKAQWEG